MVLHFHNRQILVTRQEPQASILAEKINGYGGKAIVTPLIQTHCKTESNHETILAHIAGYEWIFFTSANGVRCFFEKIHSRRREGQLKNVRFAVVGTKTNQVLETFGYTADFIPSIYNAETMAPEFIGKHQPIKPILIVRGRLSGTILNEAFTQENIPFDVMEVYETTQNEAIKSYVQLTIKEKTIDYITCTSPSTVDALIHLSDNEKVLSKKMVCIGTTTAKRAKAYGFTSILTPDIFTIEEMLKIISIDISKERMNN